VATQCLGSLPPLSVSTATGYDPVVPWTYASVPGICSFACVSGYMWNGSACVVASQTGACFGTLPSNALANGSTTYLQAWNGTVRSPSFNWNYAITPGVCTFSCASGYAWNGSVCSVS